MLPPGRRSIPRGLIGMIGLMVAIESAIVCHQFRFPGPAMTWTWRIGGQSALTDSLGVEVLCFGDSLIKHGVLPRVLEAELGRSAYNLALGGAQAPASYFQLRRALEAGARPRAVIVDFNPASLTASVQRRLEFWPELLDGRDFLDLGWHAGDGHFLASTAAALLWPSVRHRRGIRSAVLEAIRGEGSGRAAVLDAFLRNGRVNRGAIVSARAPAPPGEAEGDPARARPDSSRWRPHWTNEPYVRRFLHLADAHRLLVFWVIPPFSPAWQARNERTGLDARYTRFVRSMLDAHPNVVVVDGRLAGYGRAAFTDPTHLNARGAAALTGALATILRPRLEGGGPGPRWVALPTYRDRPELTPLIEDFDQSRIALEVGPRDHPAGRPAPTAAGAVRR